MSHKHPAAISASPFLQSLSLESLCPQNKKLELEKRRNKLIFLKFENLGGFFRYTSVFLFKNFILWHLINMHFGLISLMLLALELFCSMILSLIIFTFSYKSRDFVPLRKQLYVTYLILFNKTSLPASSGSSVDICC